MKKVELVTFALLYTLRLYNNGAMLESQCFALRLMDGLTCQITEKKGNDTKA